MHPVAVRILHPSSSDLGPLERALFDARTANTERLTKVFRQAGAADIEVVTEARPPSDAGSGFSAVVRSLGTSLGDRGLVLMGSGAIPLANARAIAELVAVAASGERRALANNRYSADVIAIGDPSTLRDLPELPGDNALPRWLGEVAGFDVKDLRTQWRLAVDLDSPLDVLLVHGPLSEGVDVAAVRATLRALRKVGRDRRAELVVAGRTSARTLRWLERRAACRVRALIEERGLRASSARALGPSADRERPPAGTRSGRGAGGRRRGGARAGAARGAPRAGAPLGGIRAGGSAARPGDRARGRSEATSGPLRPPRSILGMALANRGPEALGPMLAELGDAAIVDTRVLLAHRLGVDERLWPSAEDRFASDLLLPELVSEPWLRDLTASAVEASIPILLGGHTLVGPGIRLALRGQRQGQQQGRRQGQRQGPRAVGRGRTRAKST